MAAKTEDRGAKLSELASHKAGRAVHQEGYQQSHTFIRSRASPPAAENSASARHTSMALLCATTTRLAPTRLAHAARRRRGLAAVPQTVSDDEFQKIKDELTQLTAAKQQCMGQVNAIVNVKNDYIMGIFKERALKMQEDHHKEISWR